ncbi:phytoene dehydrogenase [Mangrovactinospora gilvigrisea]|uniref:Phytoene dehydrogenase n=1 Tax=Mangrovactinospora gilvigrisea TaxID=1428644 RepID=A0A1J7BQV2_9ACTN|nr:hydroxysqualene dehydroxylase HpnE [Mangrovactinospora gilvigrisea]OIV35825.1 phytoene dehydrogenase [Mangrovactinospora gilvigrisea]
MTGGPRRAVVVGGGLAGITAALALAQSGVAVTLLEGRPRLGGLAFSFRRGDLDVDNGQHVFLRCCTAYRDLLDRIGGTEHVDIQRRLDVPVVSVPPARPAEGGVQRLPGAEEFRYGRLGRVGLPVPLHLAGSLARYPHMSPVERALAAKAALALRGLDPADPELDRRSFGDWLREQRQSPRAVEALWDLVGVATLNATADRTSMALAAMVFKTGLLSDPGASDIGISRVPLGRIHHDLARSALEAAGVGIRLRTRVDGVRAVPGGGPKWSVAAGGAELPADAVVLAVPQTEARPLLPDGALDDPGRLDKLADSPIINIHAVYDRQVIRRPFLAVLGSPIQWIFDRTRHSGLIAHRPGAQYIALSQSAADQEIDASVSVLRERFLPELQRVLPAARGARVLDFFVTRERTATFAPAPGSGALRPTQATRLTGLHLAGAWTATGWPATMEGAVRSGLRAARGTLLGLGVPEIELRPELRNREAVADGSQDGPYGGDTPEPTRKSGVVR